MRQRIRCTCHDIEIDTFREACRQGATSVKTCFKHLGCLPKCNNCIPMVRSVLADCNPCESADAAEDGHRATEPVN